MSGGAVSGNTSSSSSSSSYGGGVYVYSGTFSMSGGAVSGNTGYYGGGVYVYGGTFSMSGGAVSGNTLSGTGSYAKEVLVGNGTFKISGEARPERVFLYDNTRYITMAGPLSGPVIPIDLGVTSGAPILNWEGKQILQLDSSYTAGDLASLKEQFSLGNTKLTESPYTETAITGYEISDAGYFAAVTP
jgi:hypothetical protein